MPQSPKKPRKSKPKFEVPVEMEAPEATAAWAYRTEEAPAAVVVPITSAPGPTPVEPPATPERTKTHPLLVAGVGIVFIGVGTAGVVSLMTFEMIRAPIRLARRVFRFA